MKKLLLVLAVATVFVACNNEDKSTTTETKSDTAVTTVPNADTVTTITDTTIKTTTDTTKK